MIGVQKKVVVIGAGVVGTCGALMLQRRGHDVTIVDPQPPGEGASYGNAGCFNGTSIVPMSMPGMLPSVPRWLFDPLGPLAIRWQYAPKAAPWIWHFIRAGRPEKVKRQAAALRALLGPSVKQMQSLAREAGAEDLVHQKGHLYVYRSVDKYEGDRAAWDLRRANGVIMEVLDQHALRKFDPSLSSNFVRGVFLEENGHTTNPHRLVSKLAEQVVRNGGVVRRASAQEIILDGAKLRYVRTTEGDMEADAVVVSAGAFSRPFTAALGDRVPLDTERGYHVVVQEPEATPRVPTTDAEAKFVATGMEGGLRLAGTVEFGGLSTAPDWRRARILLTLARRMFPALPKDHSEDRLRLWMGFRPSMPDSLPVIGRSQRSPDVIYAFGHGHVGMTGAPMTAAIVADLVSGLSLSVDIEPFSASRFR